MRRIATLGLAGALALSIGAVALSAQQPAPGAASVPARGTTMAPPYLSPQSAIDSTILVPAPPARGSSAMKRDRDASRVGLALRGSPRWEQAKRDADLFSPNTSAVFSCAAGIDIGPQSTPKVDALLRRAMGDLGMATRAAKAKYQRPRPFMVNRQPTCTPDAEEYLRKDGSYPSGHSTIGYGWGLILAELLPERAAQLVARGRAFGDSRRVCNVHWLSDIEEGRVVAGAVVARLHADPTFRADLEAARAELAIRAVPPPRADCTAEAALLAL